MDHRELVDYARHLIDKMDDSGIVQILRALDLLHKSTAPGAREGGSILADGVFAEVKKLQSRLKHENHRSNENDQSPDGKG